MIFQAAGDYVVLGAQGVQTSANTVKFEGTVYFDYATGTYTPMEPHYAGAQYKFKIMIEYGQHGDARATVTREKVSGFPALFIKHSICENMQRYKAPSIVADLEAREKAARCSRQLERP